MEIKSRRIQEIEIVGYEDRHNLTIEGRIGVFITGNTIKIMSFNELNKDNNESLSYSVDNKIIDIVFDKETSIDFIKVIASNIRNVLSVDNNVAITIARLKTSSEDFKKYIQNEIGHGHLSDDLYVLDLGTGIFITNKIDINITNLEEPK